jgi:HlyD family secretion protein
MNRLPNHSPRPISGAAMDQPAPMRRSRRLLAAAAIAGVIAVLAASLWTWMPRGLRVKADDVRVATVERALFRDEIAVRATALPLHSVMLDAVESGRVEAVLVRDGAVVTQGQVLFRLSNPQRRLDLLQREFERAQQISNALTLRVNLDSAQAQRRRQLSDQRFALQLAERQHRRQATLALQGFVSAAALQDDAERVAQLRHQLDMDEESHASQEHMRESAAREMAQATARLETGLELVSANVAALAVQAPVSGRLTDFKLQVGETVSPGKSLGRIDDPSQYKLSAQVDEYYLHRVAVGRQGSAVVNGVPYALTVSRIMPQVRDGRFSVELAFAASGSGAAPPRLQPGQSMDLSITLGDDSTALVLPNDAYVSDSNGLSVFVLGADGGGQRAQRRAVRIGRRSHRQVEVLAGLAAGERVIVSSYAPFGQATAIELTH